MLESLNMRRGKGCWPQEDPYSRDPVVWARAYLKSGDWIHPARTCIWFANIMATDYDDAKGDELDGEEY